MLKANLSRSYDVVAKNTNEPSHLGQHKTLFVVAPVSSRFSESSSISLKSCHRRDGLSHVCETRTDERVQRTERKTRMNTDRHTRERRNAANERAEDHADVMVDGGGGGWARGGVPQ